MGCPELVPDDVSLHGLLIKIRLGFDQYVCLRPCTLLPGVKSPLKDKKPGDIDFITVRENTEGEYAGAGGRMHPGQPMELAIKTLGVHPGWCGAGHPLRLRVARSRPRKLLSQATKSNAQRHTLTFWDQVFDEVAKDYPEH